MPNMTPIGDNLEVLRYADGVMLLHSNGNPIAYLSAQTVLNLLEWFRKEKNIQAAKAKHNT